MTGANPFLPDPGRPAVHVAAGHGPYDNTRAALAGLDLSPAKGKQVLLKPNAGRLAKASSGIVTHAQAVAAAIDAFREAGAIVAVGESPITGVDTMEAFETTGIAQAARERSCALLDMDARPCIETPAPEGVTIKSFKVCPEYFGFDFIVSMPVMKTHMHTGVTLAVKNMKGCLWRRSKVKLHMLPPVAGSDEKPINIAIADMAGILRPHLSIIDGTVGMEGLGPGAGQPKPLDVIAVSADAFAADAVACRLMGTRAEDVPHLLLGAERGYGIIRMDAIEITPPGWEKWISPFEPPPKDISLSFPGINILDKQSCSACQSTLLLFLKKYGDRLFEYFTDEKSGVNIAIGKGHTEVPPNTLCVGNCAAPHRAKGVFVPGCPPVSSKIMDIVEGRLAADERKGKESGSAY